MKSLPAAMNQPKDTLQLILRELFPPLSVPIRPPLSMDRHVIRYSSTRILSIITVCRSWYLAGLPILFRDIQIKKSNQLSELLEMLEEPGSPFRFWVQSIELCFEYPEEDEPFEIEFDKPFGQLWKLCPNLRTLASSSPMVSRPIPASERRFPEVDYDPMFPFQLRRPLVVPPCVLENLYINTLCFPEGFVDAMIHASHTLVSLTILDLEEPNTHPSNSLTSVRFSNLRTLIIPPYEALMVQNWNYPKLENLTLLRTTDHSPDYTTCEDFFAKFGKGIKILDVYPGMFYRQEFGSLPWLWYPELLGWVPNLEHLIVHHDRRWSSRNARHSHGNVKWIDIWDEGEGSPFPLLDYKHMGYFIAQSSSSPQTNQTGRVKFRSLCGIRVFTKRLQKWWCNLPYTLPPCPTQGPEQVTYSPVCDFDPQDDENIEYEGYDDYNDCLDSDEWGDGDVDEWSDDRTEE